MSIHIPVLQSVVPSVEGSHHPLRNIIPFCKPVTPSCHDACIFLDPSSTQPARFLWSVSSTTIILNSICKLDHHHSTPDGPTSSINQSTSENKIPFKIHHFLAFWLRSSVKSLSINAFSPHPSLSSSPTHFLYSQKAPQLT